MKIFIIWIALLLSGGLFLSAEPLSPAQIERKLSRAPAAELPVVAAELVKQSKARDRSPTAAKVVKAAVRLNPAAAPLIVHTMIDAVPETASVIARVAAAGQPAQIEEITRAAVAACPERVGVIVSALCTAAPARYRSVAVMAARVAPRAGREILQAVAMAKAELRPYIEREIAACGRTTLSVEDCLDRAERAWRAGLGGVPPNEEGPGPGRGLGPPQESTPESAGPRPPHGDDHPPGGRNYARP